MVILGGLLVASVNVVATVSKLRLRVNEQQMGRLLAEDLMAEILATSYSDPTGANTIGLDSGESASDRSTFDDVDDYDRWTAGARKRDGSWLVPDPSWSLRVRVQWVDPAAPDTVSASETGVKRVTIESLRNGRLTASLSALRTSAWEAAR